MGPAVAVRFLGAVSWWQVVAPGESRRYPDGQEYVIFGLTVLSAVQT
jgi:hypothetical protein